MSFHSLCDVALFLIPKSKRKTTKKNDQKNDMIFHHVDQLQKALKHINRLNLAKHERRVIGFFEDKQLLSHMPSFLIETSKNKEAADIWELPLSFRKVKLLP